MQDSRAVEFDDQVGKIYVLGFRFDVVRKIGLKWSEKLGKTKYDGQQTASVSA